jgi:transcriptional regulator with XRE-family HTH domain
MDRAQLADFLRRRREALQPEDVGLVKGPRRRTAGLRREEVALLASMSTDYYSRLEQQRGPQPSEQMLASIARGMRLSQAERDHLFRLAGHTVPARSYRTDHVSPALMRVLDRLDTPAQVMSDLGTTFVQNELAVALMGNQTAFTGWSRYIAYRWFTQPAQRAIYPPETHDYHGRIWVSNLRTALARDADNTEGQALVDQLLKDSPEFAAVWAEHEVVVRESSRKVIAHPRIGPIEVDCQILVAENEAQILLVYTTTPGTEDYDKLQLLGVIGDQEFASTPSTS